LQLPATARAHIFFAGEFRVWPVKKFQCKILVGNAGAADLLIELRRGEVFGAGVGHNVEARVVFAQAQLQDLVGIRKRIPNDRPGLCEPEWNNDFILAQLTLQIDLLS